MVVDILASALLIAFGILAIYFSLNEKIGDEKMLLVLLLGVACVIGGLWILTTKLTLAILLKRIGGLALLAFGVFMIFGFPDIDQYQPGDTGRAGIFIGIISIVIGIFLLFF
ncbi:MAG: hypothetical protein V1802_02715 [Candidatus Aenigmatarchaeota archaeon]